MTRGNPDGWSQLNERRRAAAADREMFQDAATKLRALKGEVRKRHWTDEDRAKYNKLTRARDRQAKIDRLCPDGRCPACKAVVAGSRKWVYRVSAGIETMLCRSCYQIEKSAIAALGSTIRALEAAKTGDEQQAVIDAFMRTLAAHVTRSFVKRAVQQMLGELPPEKLAAVQDRIRKESDAKS